MNPAKRLLNTLVTSETFHHFLEVLAFAKINWI